MAPRLPAPTRRAGGDVVAQELGRLAAPRRGAPCDGAASSRNFVGPRPPRERRGGSSPSVVAEGSTLVGRLVRVAARRVSAVLRLRLLAMPRSSREVAVGLLALVPLALDRPGRRRACQNLGLAFPGLPSRERRRLLHASAQNVLRDRLRLWGEVRLPPPAGDLRGVRVSARFGAWPVPVGSATRVDREAGRDGVRVPLLGLEALAPGAPARRALRRDLPLRLVLGLPDPEPGVDRWATWTSPDLTQGLRGRKDEDAVRELAGRVQQVLEQLIRARPDLWRWDGPRFARRPHVELRGWPPYSRFVPHRRAAAPASARSARRLSRP
jgi:hypothetical protein